MPRLKCLPKRLFFLLLLPLPLLFLRHSTTTTQQCAKSITDSDSLRKLDIPVIESSDQDLRMISISQQIESTSRLYAKTSTSYEEWLRKVANSQKQVLLSLVDSGVLDMAINFYITSLAAHRISNYLFLSLDESSCDTLVSHGIHCFVYAYDEAAKEASVYNSVNFNRKMNFRTFMILSALHQGYSVLHSDVDVYFQKNPFAYVHCYNCSFIALKDSTTYNAGFLYLRPTLDNIAVYSKMKEYVVNGSLLDDQNQLKDALQWQQEKNELFYPSYFNTSTHQHGLMYYEESNRVFAESASPCPDCVVIHNNWIVSAEAKTYRAKELNQWFYDKEGYYSDPKQTYITYDNPRTSTEKQDIQALGNALAFGRILKRIVILPKFHCPYSSTCSLLSRLLLKNFDSVFKGAYREHSFLSHPVVPSSIKMSIAGPIAINCESIVAANVNGSPWTVSRVNKTTPGLTDVEVKKYFGPWQASVLHFHSMQNVFHGFQDTDEASAFQIDLEKAMVRGEYRQFSLNA